MSLEPRWVDIDVTADEDGATGQRYTGRFCIKPFLTLREQGEAQVHANKITHGVDITTDIGSNLYFLAWLKFYIKETENCSWWVNDGLDLLDVAPVDALLKEVKNLKDSLKVKKAE